MEFDRNHDARVREAAFRWLAEQVLMHGDALPRTILAQGFTFANQRVPVVRPQGIFKSAVMQVPLSITTSPNTRYDDAFGPDNLLSYSYRGIDPFHRDNLGLRSAMLHGLPMAYFHGIVPGEYLAFWPVYVVNDHPELLTFSVAVDDAVHIDLMSRLELNIDQRTETRREYITSQAKVRLHQRMFRQRVHRAYRNQCAFCRLRQSELLDAAHIVPDSEPEGEPVIPNGLSLCRLHHAAFDNFFLGVRPDFIIEIRRDILEESDGPTLQHAIQGLHGQPILLPARTAERPSVEFLEHRYAWFLRV